MGRVGRQEILTGCSIPTELNSWDLQSFIALQGRILFVYVFLKATISTYIEFLTFDQEKASLLQIFQDLCRYFSMFWIFWAPKKRCSILGSFWEDQGSQPVVFVGDPGSRSLHESPAQAWQSICLKYHPDKQPAGEGSERFLSNLLLRIRAQRCNQEILWVSANAHSDLIHWTTRFFFRFLDIVVLSKFDFLSSIFSCVARPWCGSCCKVDGKVTSAQRDLLGGWHQVALGKTTLRF